MLLWDREEVPWGAPVLFQLGWICPCSRIPLQLSVQRQHSAPQLLWDMVRPRAPSSLEGVRMLGQVPGEHGGAGAHETPSRSTEHCRASLLPPKPLVSQMPCFVARVCSGKGFAFFAMVGLLPSDGGWCGLVTQHLPKAWTVALWGSRSICCIAGSWEGCNISALLPARARGALSYLKLANS